MPGGAAAGSAPWVPGAVPASWGRRAIRADRKAPLRNAADLDRLRHGETPVAKATLGRRTVERQ